MQERLSFCMAPVNLRDPRIAAAMLQFATRYADKQPVELRVDVQQSLPRTPQELQQMETVHQVCACVGPQSALHIEALVCSCKVSFGRCESLAGVLCIAIVRSDMPQLRQMRPGSGYGMPKVAGGTITQTGCQAVPEQLLLLFVPSFRFSSGKEFRRTCVMLLGT